MKNTFLVSVFLLMTLMACSDSDGDKMACQTEIQTQLDKDLAAEDAAVQHRLDTETLTSDQKNAIRSTSLARKETLRKVAAKHMEDC